MEKHHRAVFAAFILLVGGAQAWDAGILTAGPLAIAAAATALVVPSAAVLFAGRGARIAALLAGAALLMGVRLLADAPLPDLLLAIFPAGVSILVLLPLIERQLAVRRAG